MLITNETELINERKRNTKRKITIDSRRMDVAKLKCAFLYYTDTIK